MSKIKDWSDEKCMERFIALMERVHINTGFLENTETGLVDKQIIVLKCGDIVRESQPVELTHSFKLATATDQGATVN